jgi:hypothetical protein
MIQVLKENFPLVVRSFRKDLQKDRRLAELRFEKVAAFANGVVDDLFSLYRLARAGLLESSLRNDSRLPGYATAYVFIDSIFNELMEKFDYVNKAIESHDISLEEKRTNRIGVLKLAKINVDYDFIEKRVNELVEKLEKEYEEIPINEEFDKFRRKIYSLARVKDISDEKLIERYALMRFLANVAKEARDLAKEFLRAAYSYQLDQEENETNF